MVPESLRKLFNFFLFSSLYISLCAVLMVYQTEMLLLNKKPSAIVALFVFFATMCSYNFHWYLTPQSSSPSLRLQWASENRNWHGALYILGLAGTLVCFIPIRAHWLALLAVSGVTFLYSAPKIPLPMFTLLRKIAIGKTLFLAFVWTFSTTLLPLFIDDAKPDAAAWLYTLSRFGLIYAICIVFDYRDREDDKRDRIKSLVTLLSDRGINLLFTSSLVIYAMASVALSYFGFSTINIALLLMPGVVLVFLYGPAKKNFSDYLYYFTLDGLMMLSGLLMLIFRI